MKEYDVIAAGHICIDLSPGFSINQERVIEEVFVPGRLINVNGITISAGGPVPNTGFAMARLGLKVFPMANIGDDELGAMLKKIVDSEIGSGVKLKEGVNTSYSVVLSIPGIDRIILHDPAGNNEFTSNDVDYDIVKKARLFHFGYPPLMKKVYDNSGVELTKIFKKAKQTGVTTSLDMSLPDTESESAKVDWNSILKNTLPYVDIFLPSVEEALFMLDKEEYNRIKKRAGNHDFTQYIDIEKICELGNKILKMGAAIVVIKCGAQGIYIKSAGYERLKEMGNACPANIDKWTDKELFHQTYYVDDFKSALAGGDTTIAGFLAALLNNLHINDCSRVACRTGALCCTTYDSISGLLPLKDVYALTKRRPEQNTTKLADGIFEYDISEEIWMKGNYNG